MARFLLRYKLKAISLAAEEAELATGDIVLLSGSDIQYLCSLHGTWSGFSRCAFVVRTGPGLKGLLLCHADAASGDELSPQHVVTLTRLVDELASGDITFAVVRKLVRPLSQDEAELVSEFAAVHVGLPYNARANVLMAVPHAGRLRALLSGCFPLTMLLGRRYERFFCSQLVGQMLTVAGRAQRRSTKSGARDFLPTDIESGLVLAAPFALRCQHRRSSKSVQPEES